MINLARLLFWSLIQIASKLTRRVEIGGVSIKTQSPVALAIDKAKTAYFLCLTPILLLMAGRALVDLFRWFFWDGWMWIKIGVQQ